MDMEPEVLGERVVETLWDEDIDVELEVERLSADSHIDMLSKDPTRFFGRTVNVGAGGVCAHCMAAAGASGLLPFPIEYLQRLQWPAASGSCWSCR